MSERDKILEKLWIQDAEDFVQKYDLRSLIFVGEDSEGQGFSVSVASNKESEMHLDQVIDLIETLSLVNWLAQTDDGTLIIPQTEENERFYRHFRKSDGPISQDSVTPYSQLDSIWSENANRQDWN